MGVCQISLCDTGKRSTEAGESGIGSFRIKWVCLDKYVKVFGGARLRMKGDSVASDDQVLNVVGVEERQEFFEVVEH